MFPASSALFAAALLQAGLMGDGHIVSGPNDEWSSTRSGVLVTSRDAPGCPYTVIAKLSGRLRPHTSDASSRLIDGADKLRLVAPSPDPDAIILAKVSKEHFSPFSLREVSVSGLAIRYADKSCALR